MWAYYVPDTLPAVFFWIFEFYFIYFLYSMFLLVIYFIHISVYMSIPVSQFITPPPHPPAAFPPWCSYVCSLHLCLYFCFVNKIVYTNFSRFHIYALIYDICFKREYFWSELFSLAIDETQLDNYTSLPLTSPILA